MPNFEQPDALTVPKPYLPDGRKPQRLFNARYKKLLRAKGKLYTAQQNFLYFIRTDPDAQLVYPYMHPLSPAGRYDWYVVQESVDSAPLPEPRQVEWWSEEPTTVKFGFLRDEDKVTQPSLDDKVAHVQKTQAGLKDYLVKMQRHAALTAKVTKGEALDGPERDELEALNKYIETVATQGIPGSQLQ